MPCLAWFLRKVKEVKAKKMRAKVLQAMGYQGHTETMKKKIWALWEHHLEPYAASTLEGQLLVRMNRGIEWPGGEVPSEAQARQMVIEAAAARARAQPAAAGAGALGCGKQPAQGE